jgi:heat-inducible transcriptional repressor
VIERRIARLAATDEAATDADLTFVRRVGERIARILRDYDAAAVEELFSDGLLNVMEAPEFAEGDKLRRVFSALENRTYLADLFGRVASGGPGRVQVFIGHENPPAEMADVALVVAPYGQPGRAVGVVGVLGPTRLAYPHAIGTVRFVSSLMNELVDHLYA